MRSVLACILITAACAGCAEESSYALTFSGVNRQEVYVGMVGSGYPDWVLRSSNALSPLAP